MLTNTERQQIVEEVNAGTYGIDEALDDIAAAQKGEEVRKALYAEALVLNREGHAGSTDMIARQQIANLQTSVNGQISTLRTEVGEDIDDLETALNSGLVTQNGRIAAQNATIANVVANYNVEYGSTELWASTGETGALAAGTTVTLSEDVSHFDYIDIYSFCGNSNVLDTVPVDAKLQSSQGYALRWVNLSDPDSGSYKAYVRIIETRLHIIGTTLTIDHQVTYRNGEEVNISGAEITQSNRTTYMGELGIMKIVGRKITANTEIEDVRIGADGTEYASAGQAVRAQVNDLESAIAGKADADDLTAVEGDVSDLKEDLRPTVISAMNAQTELVNSGYIRASDGYNLASINHRCTRYIPVKTGDVIVYSLNTFGSAIALYSDRQYTAFVSSLVTGDETDQSGTVTIPSDGYIRAACHVNKISTAVLNFSVSILQKMAEADTEINNAINSSNNKISGIIDIDANSFNPDSYRWNCLHHDNFSRVMTGWDIGQNSASGSTANTYGWVTSESYDDGLRVDDGATFPMDTARTNTFSLRKVNVDLGDVWKIELNAPTSAAVVELGFNVTDIKNFLRMYVQYAPSSNRYSVVWQNVVNGLLNTICSKNIYDKKTQVITMCYKNGWVYYYFDDEFGLKHKIGDLGTEVYLSAFKSLSGHYDFINVFEGINKLLWNPNYILDTGDGTVPLLTTSANTGGYELQSAKTRFSDYADHFTLHSTDTRISHGIRAERSVTTPFGINNLRDITISFDVLFPSDSVEDESGDIFFQMHDRDASLARGFVPMFLSNNNGHVVLSIASTYTYASTDITKNVLDADIMTIEHDKWYHFDIRIKERYDSDQHPCTEIKVDGERIFTSHKGNCFNDVVPSSPQYGVYKNVWDAGVTVRERYFDNLMISY